MSRSPVYNGKLLIYLCFICLIFKNYRKFCRTTCKTILEYIKYVLISGVLIGYWAEKGGSMFADEHTL